MTTTTEQASPADSMLRRAVFALRLPAFRWWFGSQVFSASGSMTQMVAQSWLILRLGGTALDLGILGVITWTPTLVAGAWAGAFVDRHDRRRLLLWTQTIAIATCLAQAVLIDANQMRIWTIFLFAAASGLQLTVDTPARQVYVLELVGADRLASAVGLYEVMLNASRIIGPAVGGVILATAGIQYCFVFNAISYVPVIAVLANFRTAPAPARKQGKHGEPGRPGKQGKPADRLIDRLSVVWRDPQIRTCMLIAVAGGILFNLSVTVPLLSDQVFHLGGGGYGALMTAFGLGAVPGAIVAASATGESTSSRIRLLAGLTGIAIVVTAASPVVAGSFAGMAVTGFLSIWLIASANTLVQLRARPSARGLIMGVWAMALPGTIPVTGLITAFIAQYINARAGFALAGVAMLAVVAATWRITGQRVALSQPGDGCQP